ncbi:MAG: TetR/AcrR family transcriptional regulator [Anaerolineae bacterium]
MSKAHEHDRRVQRTRAALAQAMLALIMDQPFEAITIQAIVDVANVARATFYMHYRSKEELLLDALNAEIRALADYLGHLREDSSRPVPIRLLFEHVERRAPIYRLMLHGFGKTDFYLHLRDTIASYALMWFKRRRLSASLPLEVIAVHFGGALLNLLHWWLHADNAYSPQQMEQICQQLIGEGVRSTLTLKSPLLG